LDVQTTRINNLVATPNASFYQKSTIDITGSLLVVSSGATTGQINLASVTPLATGYTAIAGDYVLLVYGISSGSAELIDVRSSADGKKYLTAGDSVRAIGKGKLNNDSLLLQKMEFLTWDVTKDYLIDKTFNGGYGVDQTTGGLIIDATKCITEHNTVDASTTYAISTLTNASAIPQRVAYYDSLGNFITSEYTFGSITVNTISYKTFTTPSNCKDIRLVFLASSYTSFSSLKLQANTVSTLLPPTFNKPVIIPNYEKTEFDDPTVYLFDNGFYLVEKDKQKIEISFGDSALLMLFAHDGTQKSSLSVANTRYELADGDQLVWTKSSTTNSLSIVHQSVVIAQSAYAIILLFNKSGVLTGMLEPFFIKSPYDQRLLPMSWQSILNTRIGDIRSALYACSPETSVVPFMTDIHWITNQGLSPLLLKELDEKFNFPLILNGGDIAPSVDATLTTVQSIIDSVTDCMDDFGDLNKKTLYCIGNHETMLNSVAVPYNSLQTLLYGKNRNVVLAPSYTTSGSNNKKALYGYVDDQQAKIRYITLNYMDNIDGYSWSWGISQKQLEWLGNVALNVPSTGWQAVILIHNGINYTDNTNSQWYANASILYALLSYAYTGTSYVVASHSELNSGGVVNYPITNMSITFPFAVPIIGVFTGHYHTNTAFDTASGGTNGMVVYSNNGQAINCIMTEWDSLKYAWGQCFDICIIDKTNKTVALKRIGSGSDRNFTY